VSDGHQGHPVAIVTGAGSGIGRSVATLLHARGFELTLIGRTRSKLEETAALAGATNALRIACDIADSERAAACVDRTLERFGRLDVLVNNAGIAPVVPIGETTEELLEEVFYANTFGPAFLIARAWPVFLAQRGGRVINVSTMGTVDPFAGFFAYAASKSALDSFTRSIANEGAEQGIRAFSVNPGAVETPLLRQNFGESILPRNRTLDASAVAEVIVACACGEWDGENGRCILVPSP
jgi:meso-butanediol dehydrogenase/(S,S)-butanediol dehydrogenase/diacetyl reductase